MRKLLFTICLYLCALTALPQQVPPHWVKHLTYNDGLSDNKVNCILKSHDGYIWIGTLQGLNRYDGFRVKSFFHKHWQKTTLPDNTILGLAEDAEGKLWVETASGFCIFNPIDDKVVQDMATWMTRHHMTGVPLRVRADKKHNLWIATSTNQLYYYDFVTHKPSSISLDKRFTTQQITSIATYDANTFIVMDDGTVVKISLKDKKISDVNRNIPKQTGAQKAFYEAYADSKGGLWVWSSLFVGRYDQHSWRQLKGYIMADIAENSDGHFLIATDHTGLLVADEYCNIVKHIVNTPTDNNTLPDNTLQCIYVDDVGVTWVGMYRMGLACFYYGQNSFPLLPLGDVCTMSQARDGSLWLGTNDAGIKRYVNGKIENIESGLSSKVIVSSLMANDDSFWFGSFQGGLTRIKNGIKTVFAKNKGNITNNDVWSLVQLPNGDIAVATLGNGLLVYHTQTEKFSSFVNKFPSNYIASLSVLKKEWLALGHSQGVSLMRLSDYKIINLDMKTRKNGEQLTSPYIIQVCADTRGLLWIATSSGLNVYDITSDHLYTIDLNGSHIKAEVNALCEDKNGMMWITSGNKLKSVSVKRNNKEWRFFCNTYSGSEGLQKRLFNKRSMLCLSDGRILAGGIDGVNVIDPNHVKKQPSNGKVIFSGLAFYNHIVGVGDSINGHVILSEELNNSKNISLRHDENTFTILLASSTPGLPENPRFMYRLHGQNKRWLMTSANEPSVQFSNLSAGHYILEVKLLDSDGNAQTDISKLEITIHPPFYLSVWAWMIYVIIIVSLVWYIYWRIQKDHHDQLEKLELRKQKELEEAKLVFFTNISHELRTPLTLIISPLESLINHVDSHEIRTKLNLMLRNANRLLFLTNQILDIRRIMQGKETLNLCREDIVVPIKECCAQFSELSDRDITLIFHTSQESIIAMFDRDKIVKIISNLLSNAYKFTPQGGRIDVTISQSGNDSVNIRVADNGQGISDEDKKHIFERFFQSKDNSHGGGSGIGLNLVWEYVKMHNGNIHITDNVGGGTVFTITLPLVCSNGNKGVTDTTIATRYVASDVSKKEAHDIDECCNTIANNDNTNKRDILLVDDNDDFLNFLSNELAPYYHVITAQDGSQALNIIRHSRPDLVLTDVMMPIMDGNELCRCIKADENLKTLPVVMLTARLADENEIESRECGADDYMKKPFSLQLLRMHIDALISKHRLEDGKVTPKISQPKITSEDEKLVSKITKYVEQHLDDTELSVETMAQNVGFSRVQLYRRLVSITGHTPSELIRIIRLRHAEQLLAESQLTVSEIAYKVGFSSQRYFSKCFKDLFGYMPSEYKRENTTTHKHRL